MSRKKLVRFAQNAERYNIIEDGKPFYAACKGKWHTEHFKNENPIVLELACGKGEYSVGLAEFYPNKNFVGVDIKGSRLWKGSTLALAKKFENVAFLRTYIQNLEDFFASGEISEIWVIHPDPRPRTKDAKRRLTHPRFLAMYQRLLQKDGWVKFKTDNRTLFEYSLEVLDKQPIKNLSYTFDLPNSEFIGEHHNIKTKYELAFEAKGHNIHYLKFQFDGKIIENIFDEPTDLD